MRALIDTNILLDVLLARGDHALPAAEVWTAAEERRIDAFVSAHAVTTVHYVVRRSGTSQEAKRVVAVLLGAMAVAPVDGLVLSEAAAMNLGDYEDAVTLAAAQRSKCDAIITRDLKGFAGSRLRVMQPKQLLAILG
jgi:predicted nucleic acid-binding protein